MAIFMENSLIAGFVEKQHEANTWAWSGKTTEGQPSPSDCHKAAKIVSDEDFTYATYYSCFMHIWNLVSHV
jgi:hypothetical protein